jgi:CTP:molybdopterin cytidylyltransferase MocA
MTGEGRAGRPRPFVALVLAGSRGSADPVAAALGLPHKCLAPVRGRPMLARVLDTLGRCPEIGRIVLCLDDQGLLRDLPEVAAAVAAGRITVLAAASSPSLSVLAALASLPEPLPMLIVTADHPLLTRSMVAHFLSALGGAEVAAAVAAEAVVRTAYPETRRTYIRLRDGSFSGCNLFAFTGTDAGKAARFWSRVEHYRKRPWRLFAAAGPRVLLPFLFGRLDLDAACRHLSRVVGLEVRAVRMPFAEAAIDVDTPADLSLAERILEARG